MWLYTSDEQSDWVFHFFNLQCKDVDIVKSGKLKIKVMTTFLEVGCVMVCVNVKKLYTELLTVKTTYSWSWPTIEMPWTYPKTSSNTPFRQMEEPNQLASQDKTDCRYHCSYHWQVVESNYMPRTPLDRWQSNLWNECKCIYLISVCIP